ncbi:MAG: hypothetical protein IJP92_01070 [Lachnospiraceae bacterium]|nr:hypothetical protein [Lachnospiraceae bacterium]
MKKYRTCRLLLPLLLAAILAGPVMDVSAHDESAGTQEETGAVPPATRLTYRRTLRKQGKKDLSAQNSEVGKVLSEWDRFAAFTTEQVVHLAGLRSLYDEGGQKKLTPTDGWVWGPSGKETYYNLDMSFVVERLHLLGYEGEYTVREDGVKMFGEYVMCAADFDLRPIGTIVDTSLGKAIVCDTGLFTTWDSYQLDIAVTW